jgi:deoxyribodipyrimidine photo-lyase
MHDTSIVWFRNDLRLTDHEPLLRALERGPKRLACVYCVDPRQFGRTRLCGFPKTGAFRARFLIESLADLQQRLRQLGNDLWIVEGLPEEELPKIARQVQATSVHYHTEATDEELLVERALNGALESAGITVRPIWGSTLFHRDDLPFRVDQLPNVFTQFRIRCEKEAKIRPPAAYPKELPPTPEEFRFGELPTLAKLGLAEPDDDPRAVLRFRGGESAALDRLDRYFWQEDRLKQYKITRNGLLGADFSSKLAPWLALGCISPRFVAAEIARYEEARVRNDSTYWLIFELMWRDYFRFAAMKSGNSLFAASGPSKVKKTWATDSELFRCWVEGRTGVPFVDANMRELLLTGFMSNRGRQNVASFLAKDLNIDWRFGAEWFESQLIDYDVCSNWGNWAYVAGVGYDPRQDRRFNVIKQGHDYDPKGEYVRTWLPELTQLSDSLIHEPWKRDEASLLPLDFGDENRLDYPRPIVNLARS